MKKSIITMLCLGTYCLSLAQVEKGRLAILGGVGANIDQEKLKPSTSSTPTNIEDETTNVRLSFSPGINYFIKNGLAFNISTNLGYSNSKVENNDILAANFNNNFNLNKFQSNNYGFQVGLVKYNRLSENFYFTLGGSLNYNYEIRKNDYTYAYRTGSSEEVNDNYTTSNLNNIGIYFTPGLSYFVSKKLAFGASFGSVGGGYQWGTERRERYDMITPVGGATTTAYNEGFRDLTKFNLNLNLFSSLGLGVQYFIK